MSLSDPAFAAVTALFREVSGIQLSPAKKPLVQGRLQRMAQEAGHARLDDYVHRLVQERDPAMLTRVVDKLTTNETYFFREPEHFEHLRGVLRQRAANAPQRPLRVWSAASSSGEEAYSLAMTLADGPAPAQWEVLGTDLSTGVVAQARRALYPLDRVRNLPVELLRRHCLRGTGEYEGQLLIQRALRERVHFECANLMQPPPERLGMFDIVFLRNVLIYFDPPGKTTIVRHVLSRLQPDGLLYTGHAESLANLDLPLRPVATAVYARA